MTTPPPPCQDAAPLPCPLCNAAMDIEVGSLACPAYWRHPDNDCLFRNHGFAPAAGEESAEEHRTDIRRRVAGAALAARGPA